MDSLEAVQLINRIYQRLQFRRPNNVINENYYRGNHSLSFATEEWRKANASRYAGFSDNWCRPVVDAEAERLKHTGIKLADDDSSKAADSLWEQWLLNEMESQSSQGFVTTLTTDRSFVMVWADSDGNPSITWEHSSNVEIEYAWDNFRKATAAIKTWVDETLEYTNLITPDYIWKFQRPRISSANLMLSQIDQAKLLGVATGGWVPRDVHGEVWPLPNPIGEVCVVEIPNRPTLMGDPVSEISGVIPMQDAINLLWAYLFLSADYASMPARVILNSSPPMLPILDDTGKKIGERPIDIKDLSNKRLFFAGGDNASIASWPAASLQVFTDTIDVAVGHIAAQTRTPPTYLITRSGMSNVNSEGLQASEIGINKKTLEFQTFATPALRKVYRLVALVMNDKKLADRTKLASIVWMNPEIRSEAQLADALLKKRQLGYPLEYIMELDGLDPVEVQRVLSMVERDKAEEAAEAADVQPEPAIPGDGATPPVAGKD